MNKHTAYFLFFLSVFISPGVGLMAQEVDHIALPGRQIQVSYWRESNGLPSWHIKEIINDQRGLVWMGTDVGLVRFDGRRFTVINLGIQEDIQQKIHRITIDARQNLWLFSTAQSGKQNIHIYDPLREKTYTFEAYTGSSLSFANPVVRFLFSDNGQIWLLDPTTGKGGYFGLDCQWHNILNMPPSLNKNEQLFPAPGGDFWLLNMPESVLSLIDSLGAVKTQFKLSKEDDIVDFRAGTAGTLYLVGRSSKGKRPNVFRYDSAAGAARIPETALHQLSFKKGFNGSYFAKPLWNSNRQGFGLLLHDRGIDFYDQNTLIYSGINQFINQKFHTELENRAYTLDDGSFWMIGANALFRFEINYSFFTQYLNELPEIPSTRGLCTVGQSLYVNSHSGMYEVDLRNGLSQKLDVGAALGLRVFKDHLSSWTYDEQLVKISLPGKQVKVSEIPKQEKMSAFAQKVFISEEDEIFRGGVKGILRVSPNLQTIQPMPPATGEITCTYRNSAGLWLGTRNGLWLEESQTQRIRGFSSEIVYNNIVPTINHIHEDSAGIFWLATKNGLWRWKPFSQELQVFDVKNYHFPSDQIHAVYEDHQSRLWMPTDGGLLCFNKKNGKIKTFTILDGLPSTEFNWLSHYRDASGRLYFGGISGVAAFYPDSIQEQVDKPLNLQLVSFYLKNRQDPDRICLTDKAMPGESAFIIPDGTEEIEVNFCVPSFTLERIQYRWRIPEIDTSWHYISEPRISLFNLPFGQYHLELGAVDIGNNNAQTAELRLPFEVEKPYYLRSWFLALLLLAIVALVNLFFRWRQRQLRNLSRRLATEVAEKTSQLQKKHDIIAEQASSLQKLDAEKTRFFQDLSHEIRNPLTLIMGPVSDMLKREDLQPPYRERLERVRRNARKILHLIDEILELTKLEAGMVPVEHGTVPVLDFITRICNEFESMAVQKGILLQWIPTLPKSLKVQTDVRKLEKMINNLIHNALKYTAGGGTVAVVARYTNGILTVEVRDTGIGIPPEHLGRIFERYYQVPSSTPLNSKGGFGIGLAMCQHYATLLGGNITVQSSAGLGTTMHLTLPCPKTQVAQENLNLETFQASIKPIDEKSRILLVDDESEVMDYVAELLKPHYETRKANNITEALKLLQAQEIDLVISDQVMAEGSGLELLAMIRKEPGMLRGTPFILLTGFKITELLKEARQLGVNGFLTKPVLEEELLETVSQVLSSYGSR